MKRLTTLLQTAYAVCRFLVEQRVDLPNLLQGLCDRFTAQGGYRLALLVLVDQESHGVITAETGLGDRVNLIMDELKAGRLPDCGTQALQGESNQAITCIRGAHPETACVLCAKRENEPESSSLVLPLRCTSQLTGFLILRLPLEATPTSTEVALATELAESISIALRQIFDFQKFRFREQELQQTEERYELALHASQAGLWDWNIQTGEMYTSAEQWELLDYREGSGSGSGVRRAIHPEDRERVLALLNEHLTGATDEYRIEYRVVEPDGTLSWFLDRGRVVERDAHNMPVRMTGTHQNITLQKRQEQTLAAVQEQLHAAVDVERNFLQTVIDSAGAPVMVIDLDFNLLLINQAAARLAQDGEGVDQLRGQKCHQVFCGAGRPCRDRRFPCPVAAIRTRQQPTKIIHNPFHGNAINNTFELEVSPLRNNQGDLYGIIEVARDITDRLRVEKELRDSQSHFYQLAHHDTLTGLPNRLLFKDRLAQALNKARRNKSPVAVLFLDLDRFKGINDSLGHDVGDGLLIEVAQRLQLQCRQSDTVARLGGDEFVFVLEAIRSRENALVVAEKIMAAVAVPMVVKGHRLEISTSIGIALYPEDSKDLDGLIKCADIALYAAKEANRGNVQLYRREMAAGEGRPQLGSAPLATAMDSGALRVTYQPQTALAGQSLAGLSAAVQWQHPELGVLQAGDFVVAADECGLLAQLSQWQIDRVAGDLHAWQDQGLPCVPVTLPLDGRQVLHLDLLPLIEQALRQYPIAPELLLIELPERTLVEASAQTLDSLGRIAGLGVGLVASDCGMDRCSLTRLQQLAIRRLAISRHLLTALPENREAAALTSAVIALGHALGLSVLAAGVEREAQRAFLLAQGCDFMQESPLISPSAVAQAAGFRSQR